MEEMDLKIQDVLQILKKQWKIIAGITTAITLFVAVMSFYVIDPVYEVSSKVFIGKEESNYTEYDNNDVIMYLNLLKTYSELIKTKDLVRKAVNDRDLDISPSDVIAGLKIAPKTDTQILEISYQNKDNILAKEVLVAVVNEFITQTKELIPNGTVKVVESAELPENPISPNKTKNIALACLVGLIIGGTIALLKGYMDDTFNTKEQTEKTMEIPVIGMIPCEDKNHTKNKKNRVKIPMMA